MLTGDLNYDCLVESKSSTLNDLCDIFTLKNMIKSPTCYMKNCNPSLVDVILTNQPQYCFNAINFGCGISDWHNMIGVVVKGATVRNEKIKSKYRSFKHFDAAQFERDVGEIPFHAAYVFDDIDDIYWAHERLLSDVVDEHAPIKERVSKVRKPAFMNGELHRAIYKKRMCFNKFQKYKTPQSWEQYRKQRNFVTKLKKTSMRHYFFERCAGGPKSKDFWPTIKPFLSKKGSDGGSEIILCENDKMISSQPEVSEVFNDFFVNVAKGIGNTKSNYNPDFSDHPSIEKIKEKVPSSTDTFSFTPVSNDTVAKVISNLNTKKATGVDNISAKIIKACAPSLSYHISNLINFSFIACEFPTGLKRAQVIPLFKKKDPLNKENYRPVSILPTISKVYERIMHDQLTEHFDKIFNPFLAAFRKGFGCQSTLLRLLEDWRMALDRQECAAAILMDLSKAFDCLPHRLLVAKLKAYGLSTGAVGLLDSYLSGRKQQVRLGANASTWKDLFKGVPQGSILGPLLFNVFINDIFYFVVQSFIYNYADDNTVSFIHKDLHILKNVLEQESLNLIKWFENNFMKANPEKFQAICIGKRAYENIDSFDLGGTQIKCEDNVTLLGINIDHMLKMDKHISEICQKASKQLAVLKRLGRFLTKQGKLTIYNSFIVSNFNYCPLAWHFCSAASTNKIERIQERALRFINNDFTSPLKTLLVNSNTIPLHVQRMQKMASEVFKIVNKISPEYIQNLVNIKVSSYNFRNENTAEVPRVKTTRYGIKSFRFEAARIWNSLPNEMRITDSYPHFRRLIRTWENLDCKCPLCSS